MSELLGPLLGPLRAECAQNYRGVGNTRAWSCPAGLHWGHSQGSSREGSVGSLGLFLAGQCFPKVPTGVAYLGDFQGALPAGWDSG